MTKENKPDYAEHLVTAKLDIVKLSDAMAQRRYVDAHMIAAQIQSHMHHVMTWIYSEKKGDLKNG